MNTDPQIPYTNLLKEAKNKLLPMKIVSKRKDTSNMDVLLPVL